MPITPGGRVSPNAGDDFDLVTDLAAMQVSNESATAAEISAAVTSGLASVTYRSGLNSERLGLSGASLVAGMRFQTTDNGGFEWVNLTGASSGWRISPGQTLAQGQFNTAPTTSGSIIGSVISTIPLPIGQRVRVSCRPVGLSLAATGSVAYKLNSRNNAADVTSAAFDRSVTARTFVGTSGNVVSCAGISYELTTTIAAKVSAAMYLTTGLAFAADGQEVWIESV